MGVFVLQILVPCLSHSVKDKQVSHTCRERRKVEQLCLT